MSVENHEFYREWQPAEESEAYSILCELVEAEQQYDEYQRRAGELWQLGAEQRQMLNDADIYTAPADLAQARSIAKAADELWSKAQDLASDAEQQMRNLRLEVKRMHNELAMAQRNYYAAVERERSNINESFAVKSRRDAYKRIAWSRLRRNIEKS